MRIHGKIRQTPDLFSQVAREFVSSLDCERGFGSSDEAVEDLCGHFDGWSTVMRTSQVRVSGHPRELVGAPVGGIGVAWTKGDHVVQLDVIHGNALYHGVSCFEGGEELGLACAVPAYEDGKIGEFLGGEGRYGVMWLLEVDPHMFGSNVSLVLSRAQTTRVGSADTRAVPVWPVGGG